MPAGLDSRSMSYFVEALSEQGGMSFSNNYDVDFIFGSGARDGPLFQRFIENGITPGGGDVGTRTGTIDGDGALIRMLCDEAQLPNVSSATGTTTGKYTGEGIVNYPTNKIYSDFQLGWMGDKNMIPLKFLRTWHSWIFREFDARDSVYGERRDLSIPNPSRLEDIKAQAAANVRKIDTRLSYPEEYLCDIVITKTERGPNAANQLTPITYVMIDAFPYSIDSVPLSYGASQITKITANFHYARQAIIYNDGRNVPNATEKIRKDRIFKVGKLS